MGFLKGGSDGLAIIAFVFGVQQFHLRASITFESDPFTISESGGTIPLKITRDDVSAASAFDYRITFNGMEAAGDFASTSGHVDFAANQSEATIALVARRDGLVEGTELFELEVSDPTSRTSVGVCTIRVLDEQIPVGRDYSFTPIKNPSLVFELPDGSVLIREGGEARRMLPSGEWMAGWVADGRAMQTPSRAYIYQDGSIVLGDPGRVNDGKPPYLRLNADGSTDPNGALPLIIVIGFQTDGKVLGLNDRWEAVRYNPDGTPDPSFNDFNVSRLPVVDGDILADGSVIVYRNYFTERVHLDVYSSNGIPIETGENILCAGPFVRLKGGGFAALVPESNADNAAVGLGIFDSVGNRKIWNPISGATSVSHFGDGLIVSGNAVRYRGREDNLLFVNPEGNVLSSLVALYREPIVVQAGGKLLAYTDIPGQFSGLTRFSLPNAAISEIDFAEPETIVAEGSVAKVRIRRRGDTSRAASVAIRLKSGNTAATMPSQLKFEPLQSEISFDVPAEENPLPELDRLIEFTLTDFNDTVEENPATVIRVLDNDGRPGSVELTNAVRWQIDQSFVTNWTSYGTASVHAMTMSTDGRVYVYANKSGGGEILAFNSDGLLDRNFTSINVGSVFVLATQSDGKLLIAGEIRSLFGRAVNVIGRVTPAGEFDSTFRGTTVSAHGVYGVAVQSDDKILIGGLLRDSNGNAMVRLLKDGQTDPNFSLPPQTFPYTVTRIALQPDGKIIVACNTSSLGVGVVLARVNANGSIDTTFEPQRGPVPNQFTPHALAVQPSGRILMALGPELRSLTQSGAVDLDFKLGSAPDGLIATIVNLPGGKVLVAGTFKHIGGFERAGLARLNADGSIDTSFDPGVGAEILNAVDLSNGNYLISGDFQSYNVLPIQNMAEIKSSVTPRFVFWKKDSGLEMWFTANPGSQVIVDESSDLQNWHLRDSRILEGFSTMIAPVGSTSAGFLRARFE